ncbi:MAG TPA: hypothetical protein VK619_14780 [Pyrinomonadaceae bacterium]|nr:hypothetical protein [Pyrinomonadaceae bacterium]
MRRKWLRSINAKGRDLGYLEEIEAFAGTRISDGTPGLAVIGIDDG